MLDGFQWFLQAVTHELRLFQGADQQPHPGIKLIHRTNGFNTTMGFGYPSLIAKTRGAFITGFGIDFRQSVVFLL